MSSAPKSNILSYQYPSLLLWFPRLIRLVYLVNYFTQLRKIYIMRAWKRLLKQVSSNALVLDFGAGEAQYLVPFCRKHTHKTFYALDNKTSNIEFCAALAYPNLKGVLLNIEEENVSFQADLAICIGVMQYLEKDLTACKHMYNSLKPGAILLLYVPINGIIITRLYKRVLAKFEHYETIHRRKRVYSESDLLEKLAQAGFSIARKTYTYGYFGKLSHELLNTLSTILFSGSMALKLLAMLLFPLCMPIILCLMAIDISLPKASGNGILIELKRGI